MVGKHDDQAQPVRNRMQVGDVAPDFTLFNQAGAEVSLEEYLGKADIVLFFYPKNNTGICTEEVCAFRDSYEVFKHAGAEIMGISSDSVESHQQFARDNQLPFTLLSDAGGVIRKRYGVATAFGLPGRVTYVIDRQGVIRRIFFSQYTSRKHVDVAIETLQAIREKDG